MISVLKKRIVPIILIASFIVTLICLLTVFVWFLRDRDDNMVSLKYAPVNHALKNRCIVERKGCPMSAVEIPSLDQTFAKLLAGSRVWYKYDSGKKYYTLVIFGKYNYGVVFDSRISSSKNEFGLPVWDFKDVTIVDSCKIGPVEYWDNSGKKFVYQEDVKLPVDGIWNNLCNIEPIKF